MTERRAGAAGVRGAGRFCLVWTAALALAAAAVVGAALAAPAPDADPTARIDVDRDVVAPNETVTLDAGDSEAPWAMIPLYAWDVGADGDYEHKREDSTAFGSLMYNQVELSFEEPGLHPIELTITDSEGDTATALTHVPVSVVEENARPEASFYVEDPDPRRSETVTLHGTSRDEDGFVVGHRWDVDDDGAYERTGDAIELDLGDGDERTVTVAALDDSGGYDATTRTVDVLAGEDRETDDVDNVYAPRANVTVHHDGEAVTVNETVRLDADPSHDPAGTVVHYGWDTDDDGDWEHDKEDRYDGTFEYREVAVSFDEPGPHPVTVKVMDEHGAIDRRKRVIDVEPAVPENGEPTPSITVAGNGSDDALVVASVPDHGEVARYEWDTDGDGICEAMGPVARADAGDVRLKIATADGAVAWNSTTVPAA